MDLKTLNFNDLDVLIYRSIEIKNEIVKNDPTENGIRKALNFGHTLGHALETQYELTHGQAVSLGMVFAAWLSAQLLGFKDADQLEKVLVDYGLPTRSGFDLARVFNVLKMDKKRVSKTMSYILLQKMGKGIINEIDLIQLEGHLATFNALNKKIK